MTSSFPRTKRSTASDARILLHELNIKSPPIKPREIVKQLGILLQEVNAADRYDGWIIQHDGTAAISLNKDIPSEERKNFTIAHELGHFQISTHTRQPHCLRKDIGAFSIVNEEAEANEFAAELLMPEDLVRPIAEEGEIGLDKIQEIADTFETSLTSSAFRYITYTPYLVALVICERKQVKYFRLSPELFKKRCAFLERGSTLDKNCLAIDAFDVDGNVFKSENDRDSVLPSVWFLEMDDTKVNCFEETRGLPGINQTISLVWLEEKEDFSLDEDGDE